MTTGKSTFRRGVEVPYVVARLAQGVFVVWAAFTASFVLLYAMPSDPAALMAGPNSSLDDEQLGELRAEFGLDRPVVVQYFSHLGGILHGDLGRSLQSREAVADTIAAALPSTAQMAGAALLLGVLGGAGFALASAMVRNRVLHRTLLALPPLGVAVPSFWLGLVLLDQLSFRAHVFPAIGDAGWRSLVLPAVTLAVPVGALVAQLLAAGLESALGEAYIETARAKGVRPADILFRHALRNAALPALTAVGLVTSGLLSGSVVVETVFSRDGLGRLAASAVTAQDLPVLHGLVLLGAVLVVGVNLVVDLLYPLLDPRIGHGDGRGRGRRHVAPTGKAAP